MFRWKREHTRMLLHSKFDLETRCENDASSLVSQKRLWLSINPSINWSTLNFPLIDGSIQMTVKFLGSNRISRSFDIKPCHPHLITRSIFLTTSGIISRWYSTETCIIRRIWLMQFSPWRWIHPIKLWLAETIAESVCFQLTRVHFECFLPSSNEHAYKLIQPWFNCRRRILYLAKLFV